MLPRIPKYLLTGFEDEGWILPDGRFVAAYRADLGPDHAMIARFILGDDGEKKAERLGWLRISDYGDRCAVPLTQAQQNTFFDYCQHHGCDYAETLSNVKLLTMHAA